MTDPSIDWAAEMRARREAMRPKTPTKRTGKTPEAKVSEQIDKYLKKIGAINIRTNAGSWKDDSGHTIMGAKAGTSDKTVCLPGVGIFCAIECKAEHGKLTPAQQRYLDRVAGLGGLAIVARSVEEVRRALIRRFGAAMVEGWEK